MLPFKQAREAFLQHLKIIGSGRTPKGVVTCEVVCDLHLEWVAKERSDALYKQRKYFLDRWCGFKVEIGKRTVQIGDMPYDRAGKACVA